MCIPEYKRLKKTIPHITDISTLKQYPHIAEHYQERTRNKGHTNTKKINHVFCSGGYLAKVVSFAVVVFWNARYINTAQISYNNTLQQLYKYSLLLVFI